MSVRDYLLLNYKQLKKDPSKVQHEYINILCMIRPLKKFTYPQF